MTEIDDRWRSKCAMPGIPTPELKLRGVYALVARNITCGVWDGEVFTGIQEKFEGFRLAGEYPSDAGHGFATARPVELLGMLPDAVEMRIMDEQHRLYRPLFDYLLALPDNTEAREMIARMPKDDS
jgi:hypothetical protein